MKNIKVNLGCGENYIPGFIHVDLDKYPHVDYQSDVKNLAFFNNNSIDLIYSSHTLEYFDRFEVKNVLKEWYRVLNYKGILRLAVPDFESIIKVYKKYGSLDQRGILGPLYGRWPHKYVGINDNNHFYHKTVYDFASLKKTLEDSGFKDVRRYDWQKTVHKNYDDYSQAYIPHLDKENGILISLNVEAEK